MDSVAQFVLGAAGGEVVPGVQIGELMLVIVVAFATSVIHGATGMAGGVIMAAILSHFLGIKVAIPVTTCALIFSHLSRGLLFKRNTDWALVRRVLTFGSPTIVLGAVVFGYLPSSVVALVFAAFLSLSMPIKRWAKRHSINTGPRLLAVASAIWGMLAGNVVGPGFFLAPFLLGTGMNRLTFVGTLATITLVMNTIKLAVFGATELVTLPLLLLGVIAGLACVPGNMLGKRILQQLTDGVHSSIIDGMTLMLVANFFYLAFFY